MPTIVVFNKDGSVRINEGVSEASFKGQSYLVNPTFPKGTPPHLWKLVNGVIEGQAPAAEPIPTSYKYLPSILGFIAGLSISLLIHFLK